MSIQEIISVIGEKHHLQIRSFETLSGGETNESYVLHTGEGRYVLRINGQQNDYLGLKRQEEAVIIRRAAEHGAAPRVLSDETETGYLLSEFIDGETLSRSRVGEMEEFIGLVARLLRRIHQIDIIGLARRMTAFDLIARYAAGIQDLHVAVPADLPKFMERVRDIEKRHNRYPEFMGKCCHNDFYPFNTMYRSGQLYAVDWELSAIGSVFFDLATLSSHCAFSEEQDEQLLRMYFQQLHYPLSTYRELLHDMKYMNMLREVTWALLHIGLADKKNSEAEYQKTVDHFMGRLRQGYVTA